MNQAHANGDTAGDGESVRRLRLHALLRELVREEGRMEAAELLGVSDKTVMRAVESGRLSRRMSAAVERVLLPGGGPRADKDDRRAEDLEQRLARLEGGTEALAEELRGGLEALRMAVAEEVQGRRAEHDRAQAKGVERSRSEEGPRVIGRRPPKASATHLRQRAPEVVVERPEVGDEEVYGEAWPLVEEWRRLRAGHPHSGSGLPWLVTEERLLTLELALLEEHGLTLPPETQPLRGSGRSAQTNWRRTALADTRRARAWAELRRWVRRVVVFGLLLGVSAGAALLEGCGAAASFA